MRSGAAETPSCSEGEANSEGTSGQRLLEYLDRANLFLVPLDNRRAWYRYHPIVTALLAQVSLGMTIRAWKERYWSVWGRIYFSFLTLTVVLFVPWLNYWNLLGWRF